MTRLFGSVIVLCGGQGRRLVGIKKTELKIDGELLLSRIKRLLSPFFDDFVLVGNNTHLLNGLGYKTLTDTKLLNEKISGPILGIHAGLIAAKSQWVYITACDMPFYSFEWINNLQQKIQKIEQNKKQQKPLIIAGGNKQFFEPFQAFYNKKFASAIDDYILKNSNLNYSPSIQKIAKCNCIQIIDIWENTNIYANINTLNELDSICTQL